MKDKMHQLLAELSRPFEPEHITWKPGATTKEGNKCMALAYADLRAYQERLDTVCGIDWSVRYLPWGDERIICELTIYMGDALGRLNPITRSSTGEMGSQDIKNEMGGTVAEAQAMKRAAAQFGLGRYLYELPSVWVAFDAQRKRITDEGQKELDTRYATWYKRHTLKTQQRAAVPVTDDDVTPPADDLDKLHKRFHALGKELFGAKWDKVRALNVQRVSNGRTDSSKELTADEVQKLVDGMNEMKQEQKVAA